MKPVDLAVLAAKSSGFPIHKMGAVITRKRKIIGIGVNQYKTHPLQKRYSITNGRSEHSIFLHAELSAMISADADVEGCNMIVARMLRSKVLGDSRPCKACFAAMLDKGVKKVTFYEDLHWHTQNIDENGLMQY